MTPSSLFDSQDNENSLAKAALIGLAVSVSATGMLLVSQEEQAIAAEPTGADYTMTTPESSSPYLGKKPLGIEDVRKQALEGLPAPRLLVEPTQLRKTDQHLPVNSLGNIPSKINNQQRNRPIAEKDSQDSTIKDHLPVPPRLRIEPSKEEKLNNTPKTSLLLPLPPIDPPVSQPTPIKTPANNLTIHQVKYGDTLGEIATAYNVPVTALAQANNLTNPNLIEVNQLLLVPTAKGTKTVTSPRTQASQVSWKPISIKANELTSVQKATQLDPIPPALEVTNQTQPTVIAENTPEVTDNSSNTANPHLEKLRSEIIRLQQEYKGNLSKNSNGEPITFEQLRATQITQPEEEQPKVIEAVVSSSVLPQVPTSISKNTLKQSQSKLQPQITLAQLNEAPASTGNVYVDRLQSDVEKIQQQYYNQRSPKRAAQPLSNSPSLNRESLKPSLLTPNGNTAKEPLQPSSKALQADTPTSSSEDPTNLTPKDPDHIIGVAPGNIEDYNPGFNLPPKGDPLSPLNKPSQDPSKFEGYMWPAKGVFTSGYGWRWGRFHHGVDVANSVGTPVVASASGEVIFAGWNNGGFGNLVKIRHNNGSTTLYAHNSRVLVYQGQRVSKGQQIAAMGSTGLSTGPHVHFEVHPEGLGAVNPIAFLPKNL